MRVRTGGTIAALLVAAACSDGTGNSATSGTDTAMTSGSASGGGGMPANWQATDACSILAKEKVTTALGTAVTATELGSVTPPTEAGAGFSTCSYTLANGKMVMLLTRWSPQSDATEESIKRTREETKTATGGKLVDVDGIGRDAFWVSGGLNQLNWFIGEDRYANLTLPGIEEAKARAAAEALAKGMPQ